MRLWQVYDVTSYLDDHPGGSDSILQNSGVDCTDEFMAVHSQVVKGVYWQDNQGALVTVIPPTL